MTTIEDLVRDVVTSTDESRRLHLSILDALRRVRRETIEDAIRRIANKRKITVMFSAEDAMNVLFDWLKALEEEGE